MAALDCARAGAGCCMVKNIPVLLGCVWEVAVCFSRR
jgi:hypothetical protein